ncbi:putative phosphoric monoester hydrolase [Rosa chinensis]|uniref:Putative phosphoric monoester hydrolase n=1 Tax=Rosa chinensis TaxID=74649 RepID=A0A2P6P614_ROSCH|nr:putative phosphoric monoester hydrolase [Rosa chinensis]
MDVVEKMLCLRIISSLFIGGALAARSVDSLQRLGITHILCFCSNEIGQSDTILRFLIYLSTKTSLEDFNMSNIFDEAVEFIDHVEETGGKVLVHCFEGKSRSATLVLAYLLIFLVCCNKTTLRNDLLYK